MCRRIRGLTPIFGRIYAIFNMRGHVVYVIIECTLEITQCDLESPVYTYCSYHTKCVDYAVMIITAIYQVVLYLLLTFLSYS